MFFTKMIRPRMRSRNIVILAQILVQELQRTRQTFVRFSAFFWVFVGLC
jgi:hypothetical protein